MNNRINNISQLFGANRRTAAMAARALARIEERDRPTEENNAAIARARMNDRMDRQRERLEAAERERERQIAGLTERQRGIVARQEQVTRAVERRLRAAERPRGTQASRPITPLAPVREVVSTPGIKVVPAPNPVPAITSASYPGECAICLVSVVGEGCRLTKCGHIFHCGCINEWNKNCPICRGPTNSMYKVDIPEGFTTGFGKRRRSTNTNKKMSLVSVVSVKRLIKLIQKM